MTTINGLAMRKAADVRALADDLPAPGGTTQKVCHCRRNFFCATKAGRLLDSRFAVAQLLQITNRANTARNEEFAQVMLVLDRAERA